MFTDSLCSCSHCGSLNVLSVRSKVEGGNKTNGKEINSRNLNKNEI